MASYERSRYACKPAHLPADAVAQRFGRDLLVVVLHLLSDPSGRREVRASWSDVAVTLVAGIGGPAAEVAGLVARPLPSGVGTCGGTACDRGLRQHVPLRLQSVSGVGGVNVLVDTAAHACIRQRTPGDRSQAGLAGGRLAGGRCVVSPACVPAASADPDAHVTADVTGMGSPARSHPAVLKPSAAMCEQSCVLQLRSTP